MRTKYKIILLISIAISSCNLLDKKPLDFMEQEDYYNTPEGINSALLGVYSSLGDIALYGGNMPAYLGLTADLGFFDYQNEVGTVAYNYVVASDTRILDYWRACYRGINRANMLLENLDNGVLEQHEKDDICGQVLGLRALYYFMLVNRFDRIPLILNSIKNGDYENIQVPQSTRQQVYSQIISDLKLAEDLIYSVKDLENPVGGRLTKSAIWGLLTRAYLYMAGEPINDELCYEQAKDYANKIITSGYHRLNPSYEKVFINYLTDEYDIAESIFEVEFWGTGDGIYSSAAGQIGYVNGIKCTVTNLKAEIYGVSSGLLHASDYYHKLFDDMDLRRDWTIASYTYNYDGTKEIRDPKKDAWILNCGKFRKEYQNMTPKTGMYSPINFPILRYSDILLMYAESVVADENNTNTSEFEKAVEYVNMVRRRGYGYDYNISNPDIDIPFELSKVEMLDIIKEERAKELGFELLRKDDLIRWGEYVSRMKYINQLAQNPWVSSFYVSARMYYGNVSEKDVLWPIPTYELGLNKMLSQNPGW